MSTYALVDGRATLGELDLDLLSSEDVITCVRKGWSDGEGGWILTVNVDILRRARVDPSFAKLAEAATLRVIDGMPLVWAVRLLGAPAPERLAGADLFWLLSALAETEGRGVYLVGGEGRAAERAAHALVARYPGLDVRGVDVPAVGFDRSDSYARGLAARLRDAKPDIVFVGLGCPKQDKLISRLRPGMESTWFMGVGVTFSFAAGDVRRAPVVMRRLGLEWTTRLVQEPQRLAGRYLVDDAPFALRLLAGAMSSRRSVPQPEKSKTSARRNPRREPS